MSKAEAAAKYGFWSSVVVTIGQVINAIIPPLLSRPDEQDSPDEEPVRLIPFEELLSNQPVETSEPSMHKGLPPENPYYADSLQGDIHQSAQSEQGLVMLEEFISPSEMASPSETAIPSETAGLTEPELTFLEAAREYVFFTAGFTLILSLFLMQVHRRNQRRLRGESL